MMKMTCMSQANRGKESCSANFLATSWATAGVDDCGELDDAHHGSHQKHENPADDPYSSTMLSQQLTLRLSGEPTQLTKQALLTASRCKRLLCRGYQLSAN
jgi:hypothetical protein